MSEDEFAEYMDNMLNSEKINKYELEVIHNIFTSDKNNEEKSFSYDDGFEDGMNEKTSDVLEMLDDLLTDVSLDANTINVIIEKVNNL